MKKVFTNYDHCLTNLANSILNYYEEDCFHNSLNKVDELLNKKNYKNVVVILYDGMGSNIMNRILPSDSFLRKNTIDTLSSVFPTTTTAAATSLRTGLNPNEHGWLGWNLYFEKYDEVVSVYSNNIKDTDKPVAKNNIAKKLLPYTTIAEKINKSKKAKAYEILPEFLANGKESYKSLSDMHKQIKDLCNEEGNKYIYAHYSELDELMHKEGTDSSNVTKKLEEINSKTEKLCDSLKDTMVIILADHGHINSSYITINHYPIISNMIKRDTSIESRACSFFVKEDKRLEFEEIFIKYFSSDFILLSKNEIKAKSVFGTGDDNELFESMIGDYMAVGIGNKCFIYSDDSQKFVSAHAGITEDEMFVPLIVVEK